MGIDLDGLVITFAGMASGVKTFHSILRCAVSLFGQIHSNTRRVHLFPEAAYA